MQYTLYIHYSSLTAKNNTHPIKGVRTLVTPSGAGFGGVSKSFRDKHPLLGGINLDANSARAFILRQPRRNLPLSFPLSLHLLLSFSLLIRVRGIAPGKILELNYVCGRVLEHFRS